MSFNNHDNEDPNRVKYVREQKKESKDFLNGRAIKIYTMSQTMPLKDFMTWFSQEYANQIKATPAKVISEGLSNEEIKTRADKYMKVCDCTTDEYVGYVAGADWVNKWYQEKLNR